MQSDAPHAALGADDKEGSLLFDHVQAGAIQVATIHHVERSGLDGQLVERVDVVQFSIADMDKGGDRATQVQQGVQFDGGLGPAKSRPSKQIQAQIDRRGIEGIHRSIQVDRQWFVGVQPTSLADQQLRQGRVNTPVALLVGVGQGAASHWATQSHVIENIGSRLQAIDGVAETLPKSHLSQRHGQKLIPT